MASTLKVNNIHTGGTTGLTLLIVVVVYYPNRQFWTSCKLAEGSNLTGGKTKLLVV